jgi:hypothetical protein
MRKHRKIIVAGLLLGLIVYIMLVIEYAVPIIVKIQERTDYYNDYSKHTSPLPEEVIQDICTKFVENKKDLRCMPGAIVYAPQFFDDMRAKITPWGFYKPSYDQVQLWIGRYQIECEPVVTYGDGRQIVHCVYGLDSIYRFRINYNYPDGSISSATFSEGY